MNETTAGPRALRIAAPVLLALAVIALWQILTDVYAVPSYLVPSPAVVLVTDRELLLRSLAVTLGIALTALVLATAFGTLTALVFVQSRWIEMSLFPYAVMLQVTPIVASSVLSSSRSFRSSPTRRWGCGALTRDSSTSSTCAARRAGKSSRGCEFPARCRTSSADSASRADSR